MKLVKAFMIALRAHKGQKDKAGKAYIWHPLRVARKVKGKSCKVLGLLHDVLEDSDKFDIEDLNFLNEEEKKAPLLLTHDKGLAYDQYIKKIKENPMAKQVKIADLEHNSNLSRLKSVGEKDYERWAKYRRAIEYLTE